jgi:hypothetical protein
VFDSPGVVTFGSSLVQVGPGELTLTTVAVTATGQATVQVGPGELVLVPVSPMLSLGATITAGAAPLLLLSGQVRVLALGPNPYTSVHIF